MTVRGIFALMLLSLSMACSSAGGLPKIQSTGASPYRLGANDEVRVSVFGLPALTNSYVVGDAGTVSIPLLDPIQAEGMSVSEFEGAVVAALRTKDLVPNPSVNVQVMKYRPFFILGEVQRPGQYPYVPGMSVLTAVSIAGGYTFRAKTSEVAITRPNGDKIIKGSAGQDAPVMPGDTIQVYESWF